MSELDIEYARVVGALDRPTLHLLARPTSAAVVAVFRTVFDRDVQYVPADRMHFQVEEHIARLAEAGARVPSVEAAGDGGSGAGRQNGRALCREWVTARWLVRSNTPDGDEQYSLTSHALEALGIVDMLATDRALISESRLTMIIDSVHRWAERAEPDREAQLRRLDARIAELQAERDTLAADPAARTIDNNRMRDGYTNIADLIRQLPSDFKRVEEAVAAMHRSIVEDFRAERRPVGEVLDDYLARTDRLMESTQEGRAFEGAFDLLRDDALLLRLHEDIATILAHPFAEALSPTERRTFRNTVAILRQGIDDVLTQRRMLTGTLRDQIVAHDVVSDRELDSVLRSIGRGLAALMDTASASTRVPLPLLPPAASIGTMRERFYDPDNDRVPPPIDDDDPSDDIEDIDFDALRRHGGPILAELKATLAASAGEPSDVAFNSMSEAMRRPVELFGVAHLLAGNAEFERASIVGEYQTVRPDGDNVTFVMPAAALRPPDDHGTTNTTAEATDTPDTTPDTPASGEHREERDR